MSQQLAGPPAPGQTEPGPFTEAKAALPSVAGATSPSAWRRLMHALGHDLQGGMYRAEQARRRIAKLR